MTGLFLSKGDKETEKKLVNAFSKIKEEMNDHLQAINENTDELNLTNEYVSQIESMIAKLNERLDDLELMVMEIRGKQNNNSWDLGNISLNSKEEEIFMLLYSRVGDLIDNREISKTLGLTEEIVKRNIDSLIGKGIPVVKKYYEGNVFLILDPDFRNRQAKENIIKSKRRHHFVKFK